MIKAVPTRYNGTLFASTLEADWAATFDALEWFWEYEPEAVKLSNGELYRPDFHLPHQNVWCEVKGPHDARLSKAAELQRNLDYDEWRFASPIVVILRPPGPGETTQWHGALDTQDIVVIRCCDCDHYCFMDYAGIWSCRRHWREGQTNKPWNNGGEFLRPNADMKFTRAPRRAKRRAGT